MSAKFSEALNDCLERLKRGESVYACLRRYPDLADELEPLLQVAVATMRAAESAAPGASAKARNFARFSEALDARARASAASAPSRGRRWRLPSLGFALPAPLARPMVMAALLCAAVFATGVGATAASSGSVPGEPLYWVKTARESIEQRIPRSDVGRASYQARLAHARADEASALMSRGSFPAAYGVIKRMNGHLDRSARHAGVTIVVTPVEMQRPAPKIGARSARDLIDRLERDRALFKAKAAAAISRMDAEDQERAKRAMRETELGYWILINAIQDSQRAAYESRRPRRGGGK